MDVFFSFVFFNLSSSSSFSSSVQSNPILLSLILSYSGDEMLKNRPRDVATGLGIPVNENFLVVLCPPAEEVRVARAPPTPSPPYSPSPSFFKRNLTTYKSVFFRVLLVPLLLMLTSLTYSLPLAAIVKLSLGRISLMSVNPLATSTSTLLQIASRKVSAVFKC